MMFKKIRSYVNDDLFIYQIGAAIGAIFGVILGLIVSDRANTYEYEYLEEEVEDGTSEA